MVTQRDNGIKGEKMNESTVVPIDRLNAMEMLSQTSQQPEMYSPEWVQEIVSYHQPTEEAIGKITSLRQAIAVVLTAVI